MPFFSLSTYHFVKLTKKTWVTSDDIEGLVASLLSLFVTCLNPDGLCLSILAVIPYRVQMLLALNSSSSPTRAQQARVSEASSQARGKHYTITLTCSTAMVTYLMNKSHHRALDNFDTAPLLLWQTSASLSIFLSLLLLLFFLFFFSFTVPPSAYLLISYISRSSWLPDGAHFIYHSTVTLLGKAPHPRWLSFACESWEAQIIPLWFPVSHGIDSSGWSAQKRLTLCL